MNESQYEIIQRLVTLFFGAQYLIGVLIFPAVAWHFILKFW